MEGFKSKAGGQVRLSATRSALAEAGGGTMAGWRSHLAA